MAHKKSTARKSPEQSQQQKRVIAPASPLVQLAMPELLGLLVAELARRLGSFGVRTPDCPCPQNWDTAPDGTFWVKLDGELMPVYPPSGPGFHLVSGVNGFPTWEEM